MPRVVVVAFALLAIACGDLTSDLQRIVVAPASGSAALPAGLSQEWTATAIRYDGETFDVTDDAAWSLDASTYATVNGNTLVGVTPGQVEIRAEYGALVGAARASIVEPVLARIQIASVPRLPLGVVQQLIVTGTFSDGSTGDVTARATWTSSDPARLEVGDTGIARALALGLATVTARVDDVVTETVIEVTDATIATIEITPQVDMLAKGLERQYGAIGHFTDGTTLDIGGQVEWASSAPAIATVDASGRVRGVRQGLSTISARLGTGYGKIDLQITQPVAVSIAIASHDGKIPRSYSQQLVATATYSDGSRRDVTETASWTSSNGAIALVSNGRVEGVAVGIATIGASTSGLDGAIATSTSIEVTPAALVSLSLAVGEPRIPLAYGEDLVATGTFDDGSTELVNDEVTWQSSSPNVAVSTVGRARADSPGAATITIARDNREATLELIAVNASITAIAISPQEPTVAIGQTLQLTATGTFSDGKQYPLTDDALWSISAQMIASVERGLIVPRSDGVATVSVQTLPDLSVFAQVTLRVTL